ncbi:TraY domain-containing protein [Methylobacterium sp. NI91]|nr:TraY domain-containing protein [Methylobacterium sp. CLZ]QIJ82534.1 TraY domain-containing protein [Methylobacterium sp. NI91]
MVRTAPALREKLEAAAEESGRSLAQEAELRLERSFELVSMIETMAKSHADFASKLVTDYCARIEQQMIEMTGGNDLFFVWSMLGMVIRSVEAETGKSIRDDEFTRNKAEREVLGYIPSIFRKLPEPYSEFKKRSHEHAQSKTPLSELGTLGALAPLGWVGPWPPSGN